MANKRVTANTVAQTILTADKVHKVKLSSVIVNNGSAGARTVTIQDIFTPDASEGNATPTPVTKMLAELQVGAGLTGTLSEELKDVEGFGVVSAIADSIQATCGISVSYHQE